MGKRYRNTTMILHSKRNIEGSANLSGLKNNMDTYRKVKDRICRNVLDALAGNYLDEVFDRFHELAPVCYHYFSSETEFVIKFTLKFVSTMLKSDRSDNAALLSFLINSKIEMANHTLSKFEHLARKARRIQKLIPFSKRESIEKKFNEEMNEFNNLLNNQIMNLCHKKHYYTQFTLVEIKRILSNLFSMPNSMIKKLLGIIIVLVRKWPSEFEKISVQIIYVLAKFNNTYLVSFLLKGLNHNRVSHTNKNQITNNLDSNKMLKIVYLKSLKAILKRFPPSSDILNETVKILFIFIESSLEDLSVKIESLIVFTHISSKCEKYKFKGDSSVLLNLIDIGNRNDGLFKEVIKSLEQIIRLSNIKDKCREEIISFAEKAKERDIASSFYGKSLIELMK